MLNDLTTFIQLLQLMKELRESPVGCSWTKQQTFASLSRYTLEEAYEIVAAIEQDDPQALCAELGDMLYHIVFYAQIAQEQHLFTFANIAASMLEKHERRRPTAQSAQLSAEEVNAQWEQQKLKERQTKAGHQSMLDDIALALPALTRAVKLQQRAATVGFDWPSLQPVLAKLEEEIQELKAELPEDGKSLQAVQSRLQDELGDILFVCANLARHLQIDPETALREANQKFTHRFQWMEQHAQEQKTSLEKMTLEEMEKLWRLAKQPCIKNG